MRLTVAVYVTFFIATNAVAGDYQTNVKMTWECCQIQLLELDRTAAQKPLDVEKVARVAAAAANAIGLSLKWRFDSEPAIEIEFDRSFENFIMAAKGVADFLPVYMGNRDYEPQWRKAVERLRTSQSAVVATGQTVGGLVPVRTDWFAGAIGVSPDLGWAPVMQYAPADAATALVPDADHKRLRKLADELRTITSEFRSTRTTGKSNCAHYKRAYASVYVRIKVLCGEDEQRTLAMKVAIGRFDVVNFVGKGYVYADYENGINALALQLSAELLP